MGSFAYMCDESAARKDSYSRVIQSRQTLKTEFTLIFGEYFRGIFSAVEVVFCVVPKLKITARSCFSDFFVV